MLHIHRPPWTYLLASFFALAYTFKILLAFDTPVWGIMAPTRYAAWRLTSAHIVPGLTIRGCNSGEAVYWNQVARDPQANLWFQAVLREAATPSARLLALTGLQASDSSAYASVRAALSWPPRDSIPVYHPRRVSFASRAEIIASLDSGRLLQGLRDADHWPEC